MIQEVNAPELHLKCNVHVVVDAEGLAAIGALAQARKETFVDALFTEHVPAGLDDSVLEVLPTDLA